MSGFIWATTGGNGRLHEWAKSRGNRTRDFPEGTNANFSFRTQGLFIIERHQSSPFVVTLRQVQGERKIEDEAKTKDPGSGSRGSADCP